MQNTRKYYMPAEWEKHERTFMEWPVKRSLIWPDNYEEVCKGYAGAAKAISEFEAVTMLVNDDSAPYAKNLCGDRIEYLEIPHNDAWCRDNGPTFLIDGERHLSAINWKFNAWGEKYPDFALDDAAAPRLLKHFGISYKDAPIVLEGGSIHVDGEGTLLTTRECLLNKNRNPHLSGDQIEEEVMQALGVTRTIWLNRGLSGDETDGHVDNVACFARPGVILMQTCDDPEDANYEIARENMKILQASADAKGRRPAIIQIPQPPARYYQGERLTLSYLNFYFVNGGIILPVFGGDALKTDKMAAEILSGVFPERRIAVIDGMSLIKEGGNVHCITQQMPAGIL